MTGLRDTCRAVTPCLAKPHGGVIASGKVLARAFTLGAATVSVSTLAGHNVCLVQAAALHSAGPVSQP
jgi:hypothetical protein